jgi:hypothetical protein
LTQITKKSWQKDEKTEKKTFNIERPTSNFENRKDGRIGETGIFKNIQKRSKTIYKYSKTT